MYSETCYHPEKSITRELCQIQDGHYACGLNTSFVSGEDDEDLTSAHLSKLYFDEPFIQFDLRRPTTIKQLAIIGASTWALYKTDRDILHGCDPEFGNETSKMFGNKSFIVCMKNKKDFKF